MCIFSLSLSLSLLAGLSTYEFKGAELSRNLDIIVRSLSSLQNYFGGGRGITRMVVDFLGNSKWLTNCGLFFSFLSLFCIFLVGCSYFWSLRREEKGSQEKRRRLRE